jgi:homoserine kinase type II
VSPQASTEGEPVPAVIAAVEQAYGVGPIRSAERNTEGETTPSWVLQTDGERYFLKRQWMAPPDADLGHRLVEWLRERDVPTPALLRTFGGARQVEVEGHRYELFEFVRGHYADLNSAEELAEAGEGLARYHLAVADFPCPVARHGAQPAHRPTHIENRLPDFYRHATDLPSAESLSVRAELARLEDLCDWVRDRLPARRFRALPRLLVHGDYGWQNLLFRAGKLVALLDFDLCVTDEARVYDLAYALESLAGPRRGRCGWAPLSEETVAELDLRAAAAVSAGYRRRIALRPEEVEALAPVMVSHWLLVTVAFTTRFADRGVAAQLRAGLDAAEALIAQGEDLRHAIATG